MTGKNVWGDIGDEFLEIVEQGAQSAKQLVQPKPVNGTKPSVQAAQEIKKQSNDPGIEKNLANEATGSHYTPLSEKILQQIGSVFKKQDDAQLEQMRKRLFDLVKNGEEQAYQEAKKKEQERLQKIQEEEMQKNQSSNQLGELPQMSSKQKRGMAKQKVVHQAQASAETKAGQSKQ